MNMLFKVMLCALSFWIVSANPLHRNTREAPWADSRINQAHDRTEVSKSMHSSYKSHIDSSGLYNQEEEVKHPVAVEVQHKLSLESERLRVRLQQELAELREKLSPTHVSSTLTGLRERLDPLMLQLQSSLSSSTQELCVQVRLYLQSMDTAEPPAEAGQTLQQKIFLRISQTLDHSSSKMANIIQVYDIEARKVMEQFKDLVASEGEIAHSEMWQKFGSRLAQEVGTLRVEAQSRVEMLLEELSSLQTTSQGFQDKITAKIEQFCLSGDLQNQLFAAQIERLFVDLEEELLAHTNTGRAPSSSSQHIGSLQEDFSLKLSSLIQDILHSVQ